MFFHVLSCSFIFFVFVGCFLGLNFVTISLDNSYVKNQFLGPSRVPLLGPLFLFSNYFFSRFFLLFIFSCFLIFVHFFIFCFF